MDFSLQNKIYFSQEKKLSYEESILKLRLAIEEGCLNIQNQRLFGRDITTNRMLEECEMRLFSKIKDLDKVKDKISFLHKVIF